MAALPEKLMGCWFLPMSCCFVAHATERLLGTGSRALLDGGVLPTPGYQAALLRRPRCWSTEHRARLQSPLPFWRRAGFVSFSPL